MGYIILSILFLGFCSLTDIRRKIIYTIPCFVVAGIGLIFHIILLDTTWWNQFAGIILGLILLVLSFITGEAIGRGDALVVIALGFVLDAIMVLHIIFCAFVLVDIFAVIGGLVKKIKFKSTLQFIPFLFASEIIILIFESVKI
ncbi:prepilin peptidase [uncultured Eubacterium sp.]|uniref:prepilin peptidase n=1 Tax=uncultured Eubacterium sp. TaxID=165185 RepID=UPI002671930B|nr:prepilin peptidase [uncultured Eubacterium sp.]